jgi:hypothetical protein
MPRNRGRWRWDILNHDQFEELSALAAAGEISHEDWQILKAHLDECASCRGIFADVEQIQSEWLPEHPDFEIMRKLNEDLRLRKAILKRVTKSGAHFSKAALTRSESSEFSVSLRAAASRPWFLAVAVMTVLILSAGILFRNKVHDSAFQQNSAGSARAVAKERAVTVKPDIEDPAKQTEVTLRMTLKVSADQQERLRELLEQAQKRADALDRSNDDANRLAADLRQQLDTVRAAQAKAEAELVNLRSEGSTSEAVALLQEREIQTLNQKITEQSSRVDRERELLSAGREIRDLIAARNLHIIDVYDTDSRGKTRKAFGRVFYTEGKSLVFYAYDLSDQHPENDKFAFYVWGKRDSVPQLARNLGAMAKDDPNQKRWVLTVTDPNVLAEIDSVFVTLEPSGQAGGRPSGKRLLTAFLGTAPNHP